MTTAKLYYEQGDKVQGTYYGVPFSGTVQTERRHSINWNQHCYQIALDAPLTVLGATRDALALTVDLNTRQPIGLPNCSLTSAA